MKFSIISGSHRRVAESSKVARYIERYLLDAGVCDEVYLLDLAGNPLPLWDEVIWEDDPTWKERLAPIGKHLEESDGLIIVAPEWGGMVPAGLKNFFLMWTPDQLGHKPALIVTLSSVDGGAYPVAELRMSSYKNNRLCYIPEHLIIRNVGQVFNSDDSANNPDTQPYFHQRLGYCAGLLREYALALRQVRASAAADRGPFANGM